MIFYSKKHRICCKAATFDGFCHLQSILFKIHINFNRIAVILLPYKSKRANLFVTLSQIEVLQFRYTKSTQREYNYFLQVYAAGRSLLCALDKTVVNATKGMT